MRKDYNLYYREKAAKNRARALELLGGKCVDCGTTERLEFDHIKNDRPKGSLTPGQMFRSNTWEKIEVELKKCQLLCRICHQKKSLKERGYDLTGRHGLQSTYIKRGCRCQECRDAAWARTKAYREKNREKYLASRRAYRRRIAASIPPREPKPITHGKVTGYRRGCRCGLCSDSHKDYMAEYRAKKKLSVVSSS